MARPVEKVSRQVRKALIREAGNKCANPGCASQRSHIHHIEYKVYSTNDGKTLIAICPTCHDAIHYGDLAIDDRVVVITNELLAFIWPELQQPVSMVGVGVDSVLMYVGPVSAALFGFGDHAPAALVIDQSRHGA
jgi:hypothetical protein